MTWTHKLTDDYRAATTGQGSWTLTAGTVGDLRVIRFHTISTSNSVSTLSGGGVSSWQRAGAVRTSTATAAGLGTNSTVEIWYGMVTSTGTALTIAYNGTIGSVSVRSMRQDFRSDSGPAYWVQCQGTGFTDTTSTVTTVSWPSVTSGSNPAALQLSVGYAYCNGTPSAGSTSGYTYSTDANSNENLYDLTVPASTAEAPTCPQVSGPGYSAIQAIFSNSPGNWACTITNESRTVASGQGSWTLTAGTIGDLRVIEFLTWGTMNVSALSGGGVTNWQRAGSVNTLAAASGVTGAASTVETWYGTVTSTGTALTITYSATIGTTNASACHSDFRSLRPGVQNFSVVATGYSQTSNTTTASPMAWPTNTTGRANELVVGNASTSGLASLQPADQVNYQQYLDGAGAMYHTYRLQCAAAETEATTDTYTGSGGWYTAQVIFDDGIITRPNIGQSVNRAASF